ncbi:MAG TPA: hypothetical protein VLM37_09320 [Fibrobacteraceae bacterium]|nr:hypothetical protein [Fibrobacteraceae bacterium]
MNQLHGFDQNVIALVWDFDKTLISDYMQTPLFRRYQADARIFWREVDGLEAYYRKRGIHVNRDTIYLNHVVTWTQKGPFQGLNNRILTEIGTELVFYPGLPDFFQTVKETIEKDPVFSGFGIRVEHYIVSTGFAATIRGSAIAPLADGIWGAEFIENPAPPGYDPEAPISSSDSVLKQVACALDNTSKTRYLFEINKGSNKHPEIDVNSRMPGEDRRVPFPHMIYIADGPSDVPAFSIINQGGGHTYAIYPKGDLVALRQVDQLRTDGRIQMYGEADYSHGSQTHLWLLEHTRMIAEQIVSTKRERIRQSVSAPPRHI